MSGGCAMQQHVGRGARCQQRASCTNHLSRHTSEYLGDASAPGDFQGSLEIDVGAGLAHGADPAGCILRAALATGCSRHIGRKLRVHLQLLQAAQKLREGGILRCRRKGQVQRDGLI